MAPADGQTDGYGITRNAAS